MSFVSDMFAGGVEGVLSSVSGVIKTLKADPTIVAQQPLLIAQLESAVAQDSIALQGKIAEMDAKMVASVNATMQAEAKSEHWLQYSWRPLYGYTGILLIIHNYVLASYFARVGLTPLVVPSEIWYLLTAVVGVTAYTRGINQVEQTKAANGKS